MVPGTEATSSGFAYKVEGKRGIYMLAVEDAAADDDPDAQESPKPKHQRGLRQIGGSAA